MRNQLFQIIILEVTGSSPVGVTISFALPAFGLNECGDYFRYGFAPQ